MNSILLLHNNALLWDNFWHSHVFFPYLELLNRYTKFVKKYVIF